MAATLQPIRLLISITPTKMVCFVGFHHLLGNLLSIVAAADLLDGKDVMLVRCLVDAEHLEPLATFISAAFASRTRHQSTQQCIQRVGCATPGGDDEKAGPWSIALFVPHRLRYALPLLGRVYPMLERGKGAMKRVLWLAFAGLLAASSPLLAQDPKLQTADEYCKRGAAYFDKGEYDKAIADCTEAIRLGPKHAKFYYNRGNAYGRKGEYDKAITDCTEAIRLDPKYALSYCGRG